MIESIHNRTNEWWKPKATNILGLVYFAIFYAQYSVNQLVILIPLAVTTLLGIGISGYIFNDWADRDSDLKAGKSNKLSKLSISQFLFLLFMSLSLSWLPWYFLPKDSFSFALLGFQWFLLFFYAFPPLRFKEKPFLSILADSLYAYAIPSVLAFHTFTLHLKTSEKWVLVLVLFFWQLLLGIQNYLIHIITDFENDIKSGTKTAATVFSQRLVNNVRVALILPTLLIFVLFLLMTKLPIWYVILVCVFYFGFIFLNISSFNFKLLRTTFSHDLMQILNFNSGVFFSWIVVLFLSFNFRYGFLLLIFQILLFEGRRIKSVVEFPPLRYILSLIVNYTIYWFRRVFLFRSDLHARGQDVEKYIEGKLILERRNETGSIAVFNKNYKKYTETFVHGHIGQFNYVQDYFHGYGLPDKREGADILFTDKISTWARNGIELFFLEENYFLKRYYSNYFKKNNVKAAIVHFGTTALEVVDLLKQNDIPMIVIFYGYDAWHSDILNQNELKYQEVFTYSSKIIGVSKDICNQLVKLGAEEQKVEYIPCYVNTSLFTYSDHSKNENIILAVGRFAETKSPHLTILAFNEVLKKVPDAKMVMIGKDGGGELFEACIILARALKIENKIEFKGICSPEQVKESMDKAKVFVQHSVTTPLHGDKEGTPVAVMEALLCGLPVVATRHAGIAEIVEDGVNGFLVEEYDYLNMAEKMVDCLKDKINFERVTPKQRDRIFEHVNQLNRIIEECKRD